MSHSVKFTPNGLFYSDWSKKERKEIWRRVKKKNVLIYLRDKCEIEEGTTLRDIFRTVQNYKRLKFIISNYSWCRMIEKFHEQAEEPAIETKEKIDFLEIYWVTDHDEYKNETSFDISSGLHGIGDAPADEENCFPDENGKIKWSVSCTLMQEMAHLPVKLNKEVNVYSAWKLTSRPVEKPTELFKANRDFTLLEVLDSIYWDISFHGGPEESKDFLNQLKQMKEEITSGKIAGIPLEQVMKRTDPNYEPQEPKEGEFKVILHPNMAKLLGVDPDSIPLDDKEIIRNDGK